MQYQIISKSFITTSNNVYDSANFRSNLSEETDGSSDYLPKHSTHIIILTKDNRETLFPYK